VGAAGLYFSLHESTDVALGPEFGGRLIHNVSLAHQQLVHVIVSAVVMVAGLIMVLAKRR
jgi:hypothetical protein